MDTFWCAVVGVGVIFSAVIPYLFANFCNTSPFRP